MKKFWKKEVRQEVRQEKEDKKELKAKVDKEWKQGIPMACIGTHIHIEGALNLSPKDSKAQNLKKLENWLDDNIYELEKPEDFIEY